MNFHEAAIGVIGNLRPPRAFVAFRCGDAIIRGFHDVGVVLNGGVHHELRMSTRPWQSHVKKPPKLDAEFLLPGDYTAVPTCFDERGRIVAKGRQGFVLCHWGTSHPFLGANGAGFALYPAPMLPAHVGCQTMPAKDWTPVLNVLGGYRPFPYLLRRAQLEA